MDEAGRQRIVLDVRGELRRGGRPAQAYMDANAEKNLANDEASALTTAILLNIEDRLVATEQWIAEQERTT